MSLQTQAEGLLLKLDLIELLGQFGETHLVGSVAFKTTVKPDIDIQIYSSGHYENVAPDIIKLLTTLGAIGITGRRLAKSKKFLILSKLTVDDITWDIDITLTQPDKRYIRDSYRFYLDYLPKMTVEKREAIMRLKEELKDIKIKGDNPAFYIYLGVLDKNITGPTAMRQYLEMIKGDR